MSKYAQASYTYIQAKKQTDHLEKHFDVNGWFSEDQAIAWFQNIQIMRDLERNHLEGLLK